MTTECPPNGCAAVQVLASQLDDSVAQATQCLDDMTKANKEFLITLTEAKTLIRVQSDQLQAVIDTVSELTKAVSVIGTDVAVLKSRPAVDGASTPMATTIATAISSAVVGAIAYFKG